MATSMTPTNQQYRYPSSLYPRKDNVLYRAGQAIWFLAALLEILLAMRFMLRLFGANPAANFTSFIYSLTSPFIQPFNNVFGTSGASGNILEWTTLLGMLVYWLIAWAIISLLFMGRSSSRKAINNIGP